jgi:hypothetical protein
MPEVNFDWVKGQMQEAKVKVGVGTAILKLLETWNEMKLSNNQVKETVELFTKLAVNHSILPEKPDEVWADAQPGAILVGDEVRVKSDAYDGDTGVIHNGRRGKVVGVRYGDIIFKSNDGKMPVLDGTHYTPYQLQKRVR